MRELPVGFLVRAAVWALLFSLAAITALAQTSRITVPRKTKVELQLLENLDSKNSRTGQKVGFRIAEDVIVDGMVIFVKDTPVVGRIKFAQPSKTNGRPGVLQVVTATLPATDGTEISMFGEIVQSGRHRSESAGIATIIGGAGFLAMRGRQAYYLKGEYFEVLTRVEDTVEVVPGAAGPPDPLPELEEPTVIGAQVEVPYNPVKGNHAGTVGIEFASGGLPDRAEILYVSGHPVKEPIQSASIRKRGSGFEAVFNCWSVIRHLKAREDGSPDRLQIRLRYKGNRTEWAAADAALRLKKVGKK